jgi:putative acetyltransferase
MHFATYVSSDLKEISELFTKTFSDSEGQSEGRLIGSLAYELMTTTEKKDLHVFIAAEDEMIVGSIILTRLTFEIPVNAFLLGPVAVHTDYQGRGVGQGLIRFALNSLREDGVDLVFTYGDPRFYSKTGFRPVDEESIRAPLKLSFPEGWLGQSLVGDAIAPIPGKSLCVEAIAKPEYW